jgi:integrase
MLDSHTDIRQKVPVNENQGLRRLKIRTGDADRKEPLRLKPKQLARYIAEHDCLAHCITPYAQDEDWVFPSYKMRGTIPMCAGIFVTDHLRPAALAAGIQIADGQRFGLHSLRSSMATWMVSIDKTDVKTAQGNMRHAGPEIMPRQYAQVVTPEMHGVQVRWFESCGLGVGQNLLAQNAGERCNPMNRKEFLVSAAGFEPATHALKGHCSTT